MNPSDPNASLRSAVSVAPSAPSGPNAFPLVNGRIAPSPRLEPVLAHSFGSGEPWREGVIAVDTDGGGGAKAYVACRDMGRWVSGLVEGEVDEHAYEILPEGRAVYPYLDVEFDAEQLDTEAVLRTVIVGLSECLHAVGCTRLDGFCVLSASGPCSPSRIPSGQKASFHVVFQTAEVFRSTVDQRIFVQQVLMPYFKGDAERVRALTWLTGKGEKMLAVDGVPYMRNQAFRLPYQSKRGSGRPLVLYDMTEFGYENIDRWTVGVYEPPETLTFIDMGRTERILTGTGTGTEKEGMRRPLDRPSPEYNRVVALARALSVEFLTRYQDTRDLVWCLWAVEQTPRMRAIIHELCARGRNYDARWVERLLRDWRSARLTVGSLVRWVILEGGKGVVRAIMEANPVRYHQELFELSMRPAESVDVSCRYLSSVAEMEFPAVGGGFDTLLVKSHLGTGKTVAITNIIRLGNYQRILILSPRKSYTYSQMGVFETDASLPPFVSYLDAEGDLSDVSFLVIQIESIHRVFWDFQPYDLVIMDEVESILSQLHSTVTNGGNMINNHTTLERVVQTAGRVIMADAFLSDRTMAFAGHLRCEERMRYVENTFQPYARTAVYLKEKWVAPPKPTDKREEKEQTEQKEEKEQKQPKEEKPRRGRPPKAKEQTKQKEEKEQKQPKEEKPRRGRPPKVKEPIEQKEPTEQREEKEEKEEKEQKVQNVEKEPKLVPVADIYGFSKRIMLALEAGKRIVVLWTSKRRGEWFVESFLKGSTYTYQFYNSDTTKEDQLGLRDVHTTWADIQCLMMTTSITVGISYDPEEGSVRYDEAFLYGSSITAMPRDIAQALLRVRVLKANQITYIVEMEAASFSDESPRGFQNVWHELTGKEITCLREHPLTKWYGCPLWAKWNYVYNENEERCSRVEYMDVLDKYLALCGYQRTEVDEPIDEEFAMLHPHMAEFEELDWDTIRPLTMAAAGALQAKMRSGENIGPENRLRLKKWVFQNVFDPKTAKDMMADIWRTYIVGHREAQFWNARAEKGWSLAIEAQREAAKWYPIMTSDRLRQRKALTRFLEAVGMDYSLQEKAFTHNQMVDMKRRLEAIHAEVREGLGLRPSRRKAGEVWMVTHTIDLIKEIIKKWSGGWVEVLVDRRDIDRKTVRTYSLFLNEGHTLWDAFRRAPTDTEECMIQL